MSKKFLHTRATEFSEVFLDVRDGGFLSGGRHEDEVFEGGCHFRGCGGRVDSLSRFLECF